MSIFYLLRREELVQVDLDGYGGVLLGEHPQELRRGPVLGRQDGRRAQDVFQEFDRHVLQLGIFLEILKKEDLI